jgi:hypothetical protein
MYGLYTIMHNGIADNIFTLFDNKMKTVHVCQVNNRSLCTPSAVKRGRSLPIDATKAQIKQDQLCTMYFMNFEKDMVS